MKKSIFIVVNEDTAAPKSEKKFTNKTTQNFCQSIIKNYVLVDSMRLVK